ncbi:hypothetical protein CLF_103677 [Clonorchis sinensis]|uniref:Uncharacterized protein n=1 Tax=Clonorchis sinensis TaxID=79923 RepID=G7YA66_CLOSI|nr:hypothetical protein CLF_103677 [Clonorchis sinensis]
MRCTQCGRDTQFDRIKDDHERVCVLTKVTSQTRDSAGFQTAKDEIFSKYSEHFGTNIPRGFSIPVIRLKYADMGVPYTVRSCHTVFRYTEETRLKVAVPNAFYNRRLSIYRKVEKQFAGTVFWIQSELLVVTRSSIRSYPWSSECFSANSARYCRATEALCSCALLHSTTRHWNYPQVFGRLFVANVSSVIQKRVLGTTVDSRTLV